MTYSRKLPYYGLIAISILLTLFVFLFVLRPTSGTVGHSLFDHILYWSKFFWFTGALVAITNILGLLYFGPPDKINTKNIQLLSMDGWDKRKQLIIVYVSRGDNFKALERSIIATGKLLAKHKVNHRIDVVTDVAIAHKHRRIAKTVYHVVPTDYQTSQGSRYKARALHYVVERHKEEMLHEQVQQTWVLHLDEESQLNIAGLAGIKAFVDNTDNHDCVGQGEIKYNAHRYGKNIIITAMDAIRSGDDLGRFRFQYKSSEKPLFGMHGSFVLLPGKLEQKYGFDLGGKGSITEDAYFALSCASDGYKFKWVDGYIQEQSPYSIGAIIKQRRRWYCGLMYLAFDKKIKLQARIVMMINMLLWTVAWMGPVVTVVNLIFGGYFPISLVLIASVIQGFYVAVYMVGLWHNLQDLELSKLRQLYLYAATFVLVPIVNAIEGIAVIYGILVPVKGFDIVSKN